MKNNKGFTLMELLIVVAIMSLLAIVVLVGLKPAQRLADARDARRAQDINQILTGVMSCAIDKKDTANLTTCLGTNTVAKTYEVVSVGTSSGCNNTCIGVSGTGDCLPLSATLTDYFTSLPVDPNNTVSGHTGYSLTRYANNMIVVEACAAEGSTIKVSR
ncbi:MAG: type II secretion system protein [Candidatus Shapirobacteria bacterium]